MNRLIEITYLLSDKGQKESIRRGGDGKQLQKLYCELSEELLRYADVRGDGEVYWRAGYLLYLNTFGIRYYTGTAFDVPQTVESLLVWEKTRRMPFWRRSQCFLRGVDGLQKHR